MKKYQLRADIETIDVCECGHSNGKHDFSFADLWFRNHNTHQCNVCACPKFKKEKSMTKSEYEKQSPNEVEHE